MAPVRGIRFTLFAAVLSAAALASPAHALRLVTYNLLNYPGSTGATRDPHFRTILGPLGADLITVQEIQSQAGVDEFRDQVLNALEPGQWASAPWVDYTSDTERALFYKPAKVSVLGAWAFQPNPSQPLRVVNVYRVKPVGYSSAAAEFRLYSMHLKASDTSTDRARRLAEATGARDSMNAAPAGTHMIALGDMNFYRASDELAYWKFLESQSSNIGRLYDPLNPAQGVQDWHDSPTYAPIHTQSPCAGTGCASGAATGGLDDRFDFILPTYNWNDGDGLDLLASTYKSVGNDGLHLNLAITASPTIPEGSAYATALISASDHLPQRVDLRLPARVSASTAPIAFGTVIVGATASQNLSVSNPATAPADTLEYVYVAPAGFTAPAGQVDVLAGAGSTDAIGMNTATAGAKAGNLLLNSNDLDTPSLSIALSGTVLRHSVPSFDSLAAVVADSLDFGTHDVGDFDDRLARVHNRGYDALQARLAVAGASITGPDASRFSIVGGFSPALVSGTAAGWNVRFDDTGAVPGNTYRATLGFLCADEPLPGIAAHPDPTLSLVARVSTGATAVDGEGPPALTRLLPPFPNPLRASATVRFDLARAARLHLEVFDLSGRRVASLAQGAFEAGRYTARWNGRTDHGAPAGAGLYFVRMSGDGIPAQIARLAVVR